MVNFRPKIDQGSGLKWAKIQANFGPKFGRILEVKILAPFFSADFFFFFARASRAQPAIWLDFL